MTPHRKNLSLFQRSRSFACLLAVALASTASLAEKPEWAGGGGKGEKSDKGDKGDKESKHEKKQGNKHGDRQDDDQFESSYGGKKDGKKHADRDLRAGFYFGEPQRVVINNYYGNEFRAGRCPPGLAKKNNGCMPPGQAKKYMVGQRLPSNVIYYQVPQTVVYQLGAPPSGYRYVRVASDILLLAVGTSLVVDAIQNLSSY